MKYTNEIFAGGLLDSLSNDRFLISIKDDESNYWTTRDNRKRLSFTCKTMREMFGGRTSVMKISVWPHVKRSE